MAHKKANQKQEPQFIIEIEPLRCNKESQKRRFLGYTGKKDGEYVICGRI